MEPGCVFPAPRSRSRQEKDGRKRPSVSRRWCPEPQCYWALIKMPRRSFRHVVATGECDVGHSEHKVLRYSNQALKY